MKNCTFVKTNKKTRIHVQWDRIILDTSLNNPFVTSPSPNQGRDTFLPRLFALFWQLAPETAPIIPCRALRDVAAYVLDSSCPLPPRSPRAAAAAAPSAPSAAEEEGFHSLFTRSGDDSIPSWIRHGGGPETMGDVWPGGRSPEAQEDNARW